MKAKRNIDILLKNMQGLFPDFCYAYGVATSSFSDQANSLPQTLRKDD